MPEDKKNEDLIDVGETEGAEINLDEKGEAVKQEEVKELGVGKDGYSQGGVKIEATNPFETLTVTV